MRRYDNPVEVRRGWIDGSVHGGEAPEQFLWRVEAGRGSAGGAATTGVFELAFDHDDGRWALVGCAD